MERQDEENRDPQKNKKQESRWRKGTFWIL